MDEPWWPVRWTYVNTFDRDGYQHADIDLPGIKGILATGWEVPVVRIRVYLPGTNETAFFADDELQLRCILLKLAYPEGSHDP